LNDDKHVHEVDGTRAIAIGVDQGSSDTGRQREGLILNPPERHKSRALNVRHIGGTVHIHISRRSQTICKHGRAGQEEKRGEQRE